MLIISRLFYRLRLFLFKLRQSFVSAVGVCVIHRKTRFFGRLFLFLILFGFCLRIRLLRRFCFIFRFLCRLCLCYRLFLLLHSFTDTLSCYFSCIFGLFIGFFLFVNRIQYHCRTRLIVLRCGIAFTFLLFDITFALFVLL